MRYPRSDGLHQQSQRFVGHRGKTFDAQNIEILRQPGDTRGEFGRLGDLAERYDESVEIVVVVLRLRIVPGAPVGDVVLGADAEPKQKRLVNLAVGDGDHLDAARQHAGDRRLRLFDTGRVDQVAFVKHDEIGAGDLV